MALGTEADDCVCERSSPSLLLVHFEVKQENNHDWERHLAAFFKEKEYSD